MMKKLFGIGSSKRKSRSRTPPPSPFEFDLNREPEFDLNREPEEEEEVEEVRAPSSFHLDDINERASSSSRSIGGDERFAHALFHDEGFNQFMASGVGPSGAGPSHPAPYLSTYQDAWASSSAPPLPSPPPQDNTWGGGIQDSPMFGGFENDFGYLNPPSSSYHDLPQYSHPPAQSYHDLPQYSHPPAQSYHDSRQYSQPPPPSHPDLSHYSQPPAAAYPDPRQYPNFQTQTQFGGSAPGPSQPSRQSQPPPVPTNIAFPGGPTDTSLLVDYETHKAKHIWETPNHQKVLRIHKRSTVKEWTDKVDQNPNAQWAVYAQRTRLTRLQYLMFEETDEALITAFVERWHPETNNFHFGFGEMSITLHDVHNSLKIRLNGVKARGGKDAGEIKDYIREKYPWRETSLDRLFNRNTITSRAWKEVMFFMIEHGGDPRLIASGYLTELLGSTLFLDKSGDGFQAVMYQLLMDYESISETSWCSAALAWTYRQLGMASRRDAAQIGGCPYILHFFIWKYFPAFRAHLTSWLDDEDREPFKSGRSRNRNALSLIEYRKQLDDMRVDDVRWMPWGPLDFTQGELALSRYRGTLTYLNVKEPYHPDRFARQFGWHQSIPMDVIRPIHVDRPYKLDGRSNYSVTFSSEDDRWDIRWDSLVPIGMPACPSYSMDDAYLQWHLSRTHPFLLQESAERRARGDNRRPIPELDAYARLEAIQYWARTSNDPQIQAAINTLLNSQHRPPPVPPRRYNQGFQPGRHSDAGPSTDWRRY